MKYFVQIILCTVIGIIFLTLASTVKASGFIFNWKPFVIEKDLFTDVVAGKNTFQDLSHFDAYGKKDNASLNNLDALEPDKIRPSKQNSENSSLWKNIKINLSASKKLMVNAPEQRPDPDDNQISDFLNAMTDLIYDDSKIKTLENIGIIIEPQINFYFEF
ncbi:MAG: hypothetical protein KBG22_05410 [Smithella sp.]|nr:hypothetical protein [Smithella sp.]